MFSDAADLSFIEKCMSARRRESAIAKAEVVSKQSPNCVAVLVAEEVVLRDAFEDFALCELFNSSAADRPFDLALNAFMKSKLAACGPDFPNILHSSPKNPMASPLLAAPDILLREADLPSIYRRYTRVQVGTSASLERSRRLAELDVLKEDFYARSLFKPRDPKTPLLSFFSDRARYNGDRYRIVGLVHLLPVKVCLLR